jgi:tetratricopeptide (TPR) repeat protein
MVAFSQGAMMMIMDRDAFDYTYGDADGPDPAQRDLDALLPQVTRVCVLEGAMFRGRAMGGPVLFDSRDESAIQELASCLKIVEDPSTFTHCACLGGPTMELYAGLEHVATIGLQHGRAIRWKQWYHDAQLQAGDQLNRWLHDRGVDPARLEAIFHRGDNFLVGESEASGAHGEEVQKLLADAQERARQGKLADALPLCTRALALDPERTEAYALRGQIHHHLGQLAEAGADCSIAIDRGLRQADVFYVRAIALDGAGRMEEAVADCSMALHLNPEHAGAYNSRGLIRGRLGRLDAAVADFSEAVRLAPKWFLPYTNRGQLHHGRGQLDLALADYDWAIEFFQDETAGRPVTPGDPTLAVMYCRRGDVRREIDREKDAEADFAEARRRHPGATANYLGEMWLRRNNPTQAVEEFTQLIRLHPQAVQGYLGRGVAREALGELEQASEDFSQGIRLQPDGGGYAFRGRVRHRQGRSDEAMADVTEHLRRYPNDTMAFLLRARLHRERGALPEAFADLTAAYQAAPDNPYVCNQLAWMLATCSDDRFRDGPRAVALARQACEATGWKQAPCLDTLAAALAETEAFDEAARWQRQAVELSSEEEKTTRRTRLERYQAGQPYRE